MPLLMSAFSRAHTLVQEHQTLLTKRAGVEARAVGLMIHGVPQDLALVQAIKPVLLAELDRRISDLEAELKVLGVVVG